MVSFTDLLKSISAQSDGTLFLEVPSDWMQGRTTYGGLTAAISLVAAKTLVADIPLRSAQIAFVGPVGGAVQLRPRLLRQGKNTAFVSVDLCSGEAVMAQCVFAFGNARESQLNAQFLTAPDRPQPDDCSPLFPKGLGPNFTRNFEARKAFGGIIGSTESSRSLGLWLKFVDDHTLQDSVALLAISDCPPPAALLMLSGMAPVSSMTWMAEFLTDTPLSESAWWFSESHVDAAKDGYASQSMTIYNDQGEPVLTGRQTVTIFG